jgi:hypothetical protein
MPKFLTSENLQLFFAGTILSGIAALIPWFNTGNYFTMLRRMDTKDTATLAPPFTSILCGLTMCLIVSLNTSDRVFSPSNPDLGFHEALKKNSIILVFIPAVNYFINVLIVRKCLREMEKKY